MRTVFLGTTDFAATVLDRLAASPHRPALVVTRPDSPQGRGRKLAPPPVAEATRLLGVELLQPENVNDEEARVAIAAAAPESVVICAYGALLREPLLSEHELLNVHPSLLPRWRGAAPVERTIEAGDEETGVTIMRPVAELDAGPIALQRAQPISPDDDYGSLSGTLAPLSGELLIEALDERPAFHDQPAEGITYAEKIDPAERLLDPALRADRLERRVRALTPHIGTYVELSWGERLGVVRAGLVPDEGPASGALVESHGRLLYGTAAGALELLTVHPAGRRPMDASAWLRGNRARLAG